MYKIVKIGFFVVICNAYYLHPAEEYENKLGLDWGTNYYGNTFSLTYQRPVFESIDVAFIYAKGFVDITTEGGEGFYITSNTLGEKGKIDISLDHLLKFMVFYERDVNERIQFFDLLTPKKGGKNYPLSKILPLCCSTPQTAYAHQFLAQSDKADKIRLLGGAKKILNFF